MKRNVVLLIIVLVLLLGGTGFVVSKALTTQAPVAHVVEREAPTERLEPLDPAISVAVTKSRVKENTVVLSVKGMGGKMKTLAYELSYTSQGIVQGVTSKPVDVSGMDSFVRDDIYLGTCSRNVCRPHPGVTSVSVVLEFTNASGAKSQFSKEYEL